MDAIWRGAGLQELIDIDEEEELMGLQKRSG
jgi:hypothetical protein